MIKAAAMGGISRILHIIDDSGSDENEREEDVEEGSSMEEEDEDDEECHGADQGSTKPAAFDL